ncbi:MAG: hypothetical protein LBI72_14280 [Flavobacteriaceae bacterium]|jgi:hypothetical protein|nr:hypothetical protein [Flavobacteriaceae bacterium]
MKKKIIPLVVLLGTIGAYAQTGIGTTLPHESAEMEVSSASKGVLIPRLTLTSETDKTTIVNGSQAESLLVYHKGIPGLEAGFYFWANNKWNAIVSNSTLYKYIKETAKEGNVHVSTIDGKDFIFTWIDSTTKVEKTITLGDLVKSMETITSLAAGTDPAKATLVYTSEDKTDPIKEINLTELLEGSTDFNNFLKTVINSTATVKETITKIEVGGKNGDGKNNGVYKYFNEELAKEGFQPFLIDVVGDVENNFQAIIDNPNVTTILNTYIKTKVLGNVTYENGKFWVTITDGNGGSKLEEIDITKLIKDNSIVAKLDITPATENANNVKAGFVFNDGKTGSVDKAFAETLTTLKSEDITVYVYMDLVDGDYLEVHENVERPADGTGQKPTPLRTYETKKFVYTNEKEDTVEFKGSDLFGGTGAGKTNETLTKLELQSDYDGSNRKALVYTDENRLASPIYVDELFKQGETLTALNVDYDARKMTYKDEEKSTKEFDLDLLVKQPWLTTNGKAATANGQDMYAMGWVGIGVKARTGAPNERLSVDGSITATNSYYADYVFEKYFDGYSSLKYDYNFKDLNSVNSFIKENRHLPGITPISELTKTETGYAFNVSELSIQLLEKTEELFLHVIEQQKELNAKETRIEKLESEVSDMTKRLQALEALLIK